MSKSPNSFTPLAGGLVGVAALAFVSINFADRNIAPFPENVHSIDLGTALPLVAAANADVATSHSGAFGLGRPALAKEIAAWDVNIMPDGEGLPVGSGDVATGDEVFSDNCAVCHGDFAEGVDNWPKLAGGFDTLADKDPVKTVGSYWPHLSTVWDYVHRSMPFGAAQTLSPDEVYAITAYILYSNDLVDEDFVLSNENFTDVKMHNADGFVVDDRPTTEYPLWTKEPCMENCKDAPVEITMRASVLDVTPDQGGSDAAEPAVTQEVAPKQETVQATEPNVQDTAAEETTVVASADAVDPDLAAKGKKVFKKCKSCHQIGEGAKNRTGPILTGVVGRPMGAEDGFKYSKALKAMADEGGVWDEEALHAFLTKPKSYIKGTKMSFAGLKKDKDVDAIIAYLRSVRE